jgi:TonB family protein
MSAGRLMPWIVSLGLHAALVVFLLAGAYGLASRAVPERAVEVLLVGPRVAASPAGGTVAAGTRARQRGGSDSAAAPALAPRAFYDAPRGSEPVEDAVPGAAAETPPGAAGGMQLPALQDALSEAPSAGDGPRGSAGDAGLPAGVNISWTGASRRLVRWRDPRSPAVLGVTGQEVEVRARFAVTPSGTVSRVEIVRKSGYIEVDNSVEEALRYSLYSPVEGSKDAVGTIRFRFRPVRQD